MSRDISRVEDDVDAKGAKYQLEKMQTDRIIEEESAEVGTVGDLSAPDSLSSAVRYDREK